MNIEEVISVKFIGLFIDNRLIMEYHVDSIYRKLCRGITLSAMLSAYYILHLNIRIILWCDFSSASKRRTFKKKLLVESISEFTKELVKMIFGS